jgi:large subunit ribosomal protein L30
MYAIVRLRGSVNMPPEIKDTMQMFRLTRANHCVVFPENKDIEGMLRKVKNYVTWGEIAPETLEKLLFKRGRLEGDKRIEKADVKSLAKKITERGFKEAKVKPVFRLSPPSGGLKSVKLSYPKGDMGYRKDEINRLVSRML